MHCMVEPDHLLVQNFSTEESTKDSVVLYQRSRDAPFTISDLSAILPW